MRIITPFLVGIFSAVILSACNYTGQSNTTSTTQPIPPVTSSITPTPTPVKSLNELNLELDSTIDDGGKADLNALQKDSSGL